MTLQQKMPWNLLRSLLGNLTQTLEDSRKVIAILLRKLEKLHLKTIKYGSNDELSISTIWQRHVRRH